VQVEPIVRGQFFCLWQKNVGRVSYFVCRQLRGAGSIADEININLKIRIPTIIERPMVLILLLYRRLRYGYAFRRIKLTRCKYAIVDADDYYRLVRYKWYAQKAWYTYYAVRNEPGNGGAKKKSILMHREVIKVGDGLVVDHINHNGLDNRKANLREATFAQNNYNRRKIIRNKSSKYKGVYRHRGKKWRAMIKVNKKSMHIGSFDDEDKAARAYDLKARELQGDFVETNFPL